MRAAIFEHVGSPLALGHIPDPTPGRNQVVVKVERCGICATDLHITENETGILPAGCVLGHEYAGEIIALGTGISSLRIGERVCALPLDGCGVCEPCLAGSIMWCPTVKPAWGGFAEYALANLQSCIRLPDELSAADGALVEPMAAALHAVNLAQVDSSTSVVVIGAGPIGLSVAFWASRRGAHTVLVAGSRRQAAIAHRMGLSNFLVNNDSTSAAIAEELRGAPNIVFECSGRRGLIQQSVEWVRPRGLVVVVGLCVQPDTLVPIDAALKELRIHFSIAYSASEYARAMELMVKELGATRAMVTDTVGLDVFPAYFEGLRSDRSQCKAMLDPHRNHP